MISRLNRLVVLVGLSLLPCSIAFSQNLIPNPGFEDQLYCPNSSSELIYAVPWYSPSNATPDLFHECATAPSFGVPNNFFGYQPAHSGAGYAGGYWRIMNFDSREYIASPLLEPLIAGHHYNVSFWVNLPELYCGINQGGAYFSENAIDQDNVDIINVIPQISSIGTYLNDYETWVKISGCYEAEGGEQFITIGNFAATSNSPFDPACNLNDKAYYFIDDVVVLDDDAYVLELGDPVYVCDQYVIAPEVPGAEYEWSDGSTGSTLTVTQTGIYSVTITNSCSSQNDEIEVTVHTSIPVDLGPDLLTMCEGDSYLIQLQPDTNEYEWQDGSTGPEFLITEPGVYTVTVNDGCEITSDQILVTTDIPPPPSLLPDDVTFCPGDFMDLDFDPSYGAYLWQDGTPSPYYTITSPGQYSLTISNACGNFVDDLTVFALYPPAFTLGPDSVLLCEGTSLDISLDPHLGTFNWQDGNESNSYSIQEPGIYAVTVANDCGSTSQQIIIVSGDTLEQVDLGPDLHICPGDAAILNPGIQSAQYVWQDMSTASTLLVNSEGVYYVQVFNACSAGSDTLVVFSDAVAPTMDLPDQLLLCTGDSVILQTSVQNVSITWSDHSNADSLIVYAPGEYSVEVSNSCGSDADTVLILDGGPLPSVSIGNDISFCDGDSMILTPLFSDVASWLWSDGSSFPTNTIYQEGIVSVEVSNSCGTSSDTLYAFLLPETPLFDLGSDTSLCPGSTLQLSFNSPGITIEWSDGSEDNQFVINNPGTYFATITNSCGTTSDTIVVDQLPPPPTLDLGIDQSLCPGEMISLTPGIPDVNYLWQDGSTGNSFIATQPGLITLTLSNACGNATDSLNIAISNNGPDVNLGPDVLACEGQAVTLTSDISGVNYLWQDGSTESAFTANSTGVYYLQVSNNCGMDVDSVNVDINGTPPNTELGPDTILCKGSLLLLSSTADPGTVLLWQDGSVATTFSVSSAGVYSLAESNHCGTNSDSVVVSFLDPPIEFKLGPDTTLCPGESILLTVPYSGAEIKWQDGSSSNTMLADQAQTYSLMLSNKCGVEKDALVLSFDHHVPVVELGPSQILCPDESIDLDVTQSFPATYSWNTGSTLPLINIIHPGSYAVTVSSLCADVRDAIIIEQDDCFTTSLYLPNVFSPNDDNVNDVFSLNTNPELQITALEGTIFDRWGNQVFHSDEIAFSWDGRFHDELMQSGVYTYVIQVDFVVNGRQQRALLSGDVTLIR